MIYLLTKTEKAYLSNYMNKVSRSFALVAPQIESPLNDYMAVAYLICRVVDNIEDCVIPHQDKQTRFAQFTTLLNYPEQAVDILTNWDQANWDGLSGNEIELMTIDNGRMLWQIYVQIPPAYRTSIQKWASEMAFGMALVTNLDDNTFFTTRHQIRLPLTAVNYNKYCYYVASTVGNMITELAITHYNITANDKQKLLTYSEICGRALQKTNIIKDFAKDLARGDCFLPDEWLQQVDYAPFALQDVPFWWKKMVLLDVLNELDNSVNYVTSLPKTAVGYRKAGLLMMLPAYQTLLLAAKQYPTLFTSNHAVKISRPTMGKCLLQAQTMATNDEAIHSYAQDVSQQIKQTLQEDVYPTKEIAHISQ